MRVWIDVTNSPHVVFFRPLVAPFEARGHDVTITARTSRRRSSCSRTQGSSTPWSARPTPAPRVLARSG